MGQHACGTTENIEVCSGREGRWRRDRMDRCDARCSPHRVVADATRTFAVCRPTRTRSPCSRSCPSKLSSSTCSGPDGRRSYAKARRRSPSPLPRSNTQRTEHGGDMCVMPACHGNVPPACLSLETSAYKLPTSLKIAKPQSAVSPNSSHQRRAWLERRGRCSSQRCSCARRHWTMD